MPASTETPFTREVKRVLRSIPRGRVVTYGQVAALAGRDGAARGVAWILHSSSEAAGLPWHRVVGGRGTISLPRGRGRGTCPSGTCPRGGRGRGTCTSGTCPRGGFEDQKKRLVAEGVAVGPGGRIDLKLYQWESASSAAARSRAARRYLRALTQNR